MGPGTHPIRAEVPDVAARVRQLRRDHLREGAGGPPAAGGLRRRGTLRRGTARLLPRPRLGQHDPRRPDARDRRGGRPGPRPSGRRAGSTGRGPTRSSCCPTRASAPGARKLLATSPDGGEPRRHHLRIGSYRRTQDSDPGGPPVELVATTDVETTGTTHDRRPPRRGPPPAQRRRPHLRGGPHRRGVARGDARPRARPARTPSRGPLRSPPPGTCWPRASCRPATSSTVSSRSSRPSGRPGSSSRSSPWLCRPPSGGAPPCSCPGAWPGWPRSPPGGRRRPTTARPPSTPWPAPPPSPEHFELLDREARVQRRPGVAGAHPPRVPGQVRRGRRPAPCSTGIPTRTPRSGPSPCSAACPTAEAKAEAWARVFDERAVPAGSAALGEMAGAFWQPVQHAPAGALGRPLPRGGHLAARRGDAGHAQPGQDHGAGHRGRRLAGPGPRRGGGGGRRPPGAQRRCSPRRTAWPG